MGLFGKKKIGENLKTLSEKDIQSKLYGRFKTEQAVVGDNVNAWAAKPVREAVKPQPPASPDLFRNPSTEQKSAIKRFTEQESETVLKNAPVVDRPKPRVAEAYSSKPAGQIVSKIFGVIFDIFRTVLSGVIGFLFSIDLKKPQTLRMVYWAGAIGFLGIVFISIHLLNSKREVAMKNPAPPRHVQPAHTALPAAEAQTEMETKVKPAAATPLSKPAVETPAPVVVTTAAAAPETPASAPAARQGKIAIQIATFATKEDAAKLEGRIKQEGFSAFVKTLDRPGGRTYFCVFIGRFQTSQEAEADLARFKKKEIAKPFQDAFVRSL